MRAGDKTLAVEQWGNQAPSKDVGDEQDSAQDHGQLQAGLNDAKRDRDRE